MTRSIFLIGLCCLVLVSGCSKSDNQKKFEDQAFSTPANITEMDANGRTVEGGTSDPDDWRIGPDFQGLILIETPAYPNPVNLNGQVRIDVSLLFDSNVNELNLFAFRDPTENPVPITTIFLDPGVSRLETVQLDPVSFSSSPNPERVVGLNRLLIYDSNNNLISYGDIRVE